MRLSLLRSPGSPDPDADRGEHRFTYSLLPHAGDWVEAETVLRAAELNMPMNALVGRSPRSTKPWITMVGLRVAAETLKPAENGEGWILRIYEPNGARGSVTIRPGIRLQSVIETNLVEENEEEIAVVDGGFEVSMKPFQIRTFRLLQ
jgi:alpha-mannosidase